MNRGRENTWKISGELGRAAYADRDLPEVEDRMPAKPERLSASQDQAEEWKRPPREWAEPKTQFAVIFGERFVI